MWRHLLAVAVVAAVGGAAVGQGKEDPRKEQERKLKEQHEKWEEEWKGYFKNTSELPDLAAKVNKWGALPTVEVGKDDPPAVRAAKRAMNAQAERFRLICLRIEAGSYDGGSMYTQFTECVFGRYAAAALLYDTPDKLLPFAEAVVVSLMGAEDFYFIRTKQGIEETQLMPQLLAARCRAEVTVLKLREQAKKK